jgi:MYXO-CTERM domain-containing protein
MKTLGLAATAAILFYCSAAHAGGEPFYLPAGDLVPGSGSGAADETVYAPGMRYPIQDAPSYPNSQVWGVGGSAGPGGSQCDAANFSYPWRDNYCETRSWDMPLCPSGTGHQGQDIRGATCDALVYPIVASQAGTVTNIGSYSVYVTAADGMRFDYLHGGAIAVSGSQALERGDMIGMVSNEFGGTATTVHLHFNLRQDVAGLGQVYVSPYMSLVAAYEELTGLGSSPPAGPLDAIDCESIRGWAQDPDAPEAPVEVQVWFGGPSDDPNATGITVLADVPRDDLCEPLGSCAHGFEVGIPRSLQDDASHAVHVYAVDNDGASTPQLEASPGAFTCAAPAVPDGVRRRIGSPEVLASWSLSTFWDMARPGDAIIDAIEEGAPLSDTPLVVRGEDDPEDALWLIDEGRKRSLADAAVRERWSIATTDAQIWPQASVDGVPVGTPVRGDIFMVSGTDLVVYLIDDAQCPPDETCDAGEDSGVGDEEGDDEGEADGTAAGDDGEGEGGTDSSALPGAQGDDGDGCGCTTTSNRDAVQGLALLVLVAGWRRQRPRRSSNSRVNAARE